MLDLKRAAYGGKCILQASKIRTGKYSRGLSYIKNCVGCLILQIKGQLFRLNAGSTLKKKNSSGTEINEYKSGTAEFCCHLSWFQLR